MTAVVTEAMVDRATTVLAERVLALMRDDMLYSDVAREAITAALNPPEDRACLCGCPRERTGNSRFYEDACRTRHWKETTGYVRSDPKAESSSRNGGNGAKTPDSRPRRPGGLQVSYLRVRALLEGEIALHVLGSPVESARATRWAEDKLRPLLSDRQRARRERMDVV